MNQTLTRAFQQVIRNYDLISTGRLLNSVRVEIQLVGFQPIIDITCEDYVKYHLYLGLLDDFLSDPAVETEIGNIYLEEVERVMQAITNGDPVDLPDVVGDALVLVNGE